MIMARASCSPMPNLFAWREQSEIAQLQAQRDDLLARIRQLRPHCHRRIVLQARLIDLTAHQLELESLIGGRL